MIGTERKRENMNIKALFNLKRDFNKLQENGTIDQFYDFSKQTIADVALKQIKNEDKKRLAVSVVLGYVAKAITPVNPIIGAILSFVLPEIIERLYQALKTYLEGITQTP